MQRTLGTILLAVLVVFAGCGGVLGGGSNEPKVTLTPMAVPTDKPTPTPVPQLAPGLTRQGIENASALVAAHASFLVNRSFTIRSNSTTLATNGSVLDRETAVLYVGPPGEGFHLVPKGNGSDDHQYSETGPVRIEWWSGGERVLLKRTYANGTTTYHRLRTDAEQIRYSITSGSLYFLESFGAANTTVAERFTRNGTTLYRVRGTTQTAQWGNVSIQLLVDSRGVVHEYKMVRQVPFGISRHITKAQFFAINATDAPERPSWVDEAMNRTTPTQPVGTTRSSE